MFKNLLNSKRKLTVILSAVIILCVLFFATLLLLNSNHYSFYADENNDGITDDKKIIYQDQQIEIYTLFPSSVINTDGDNQFVDDLASLEFKNISGSFIKKCEIDVDTEDGETLTFIGEDIPDQMNVLAFEVSNKPIDEEDLAKNFDCSVELDSTDVMLEDSIKISGEEIEIKVKNKSRDDLSNLVVTCHCMMDDVSYGGSTYDYIIPELKAGKSATIYAEDCYFGEAKVVKVTVKQ